VRLRDYFILRGIYIIFFTLVSFVILLQLLTKLIGLNVGGVYIVLVPSYLITLGLGLRENFNKYIAMEKQKVVANLVRKMFLFDSGISLCALGSTMLIAGVFLTVYFLVDETTLALIIISLFMIIISIILFIIGLRRFRKSSHY